MLRRMPAAVPDDRRFFGHPRGLASLFFTEMWERFSYYGMRALLILFMTAAPATGGLGFDAATAGSVYGLYTFGVWALGLPGGWIADRLIGQRRAVLYGGILISAGHFSLAVPTMGTFFAGLLLVVLGTGLLKPNVAAIVGDLYPEKGARLDAGFSVFYMGINLGAFLGPLVCSWLGEPRAGAAWVNWHYGFAAAGVGMTFGLIQYVLGQRHLRHAGESGAEAQAPVATGAARRQFGVGLGACLLVVAAAVAGGATGVLPFTLAGFAENVFYVVSVLFVAYGVFVLAALCRDQDERRRMSLALLLCVAAALFWSGFEQAGSTMNLFARDLTDRTLFGTEIAAGALQSVNPLFIVLLAPVMGAVWLRLGARSASMAGKFGAGLILLAVGFLVLAWASTRLVDGPVGMRWLVATYFFHTVGELCLSPVGMSSMVKLAPRRLAGQMMGTWYMSVAIGSLVAGLVARFLPAADTVAAATTNSVQLFGTIAAITVVAGLVLLALARPLRRLQGDIL
jgi:POT family proton-dependent oligopeptide transporter